MFCVPPSQSPAAPLRLSLAGQNINHITSSQKKKRKSNSIAGPSSLDEENRLKVATNLFVDTDFDLSPEENCNQRLSKSPRLEIQIEPNQVISTEHLDYIAEKNLPHSPNYKTNNNNNNNNNESMMTTTLPSIDTLNDDFKSSRIHSDSPNASECGTEISSVSQRRAWLKTFEKKQQSNIFRSMPNTKVFETTQTRQNEERKTIDKDARQSPPDSPKANVSFDRISNSATKPIQRKPIMNRRASSTMIHSWQTRTHEGVQATDEGYASVASLSKWLESDPTASKKKKQIRRGRNILSKSRQFEKDQGDVIIVENNISRGAVGDKKKWLQKAFHSSAEQDPDDDACSGYSGFVQSDVGGRTIRSYPRFNRPGAQTEIITDDAASSLSVSDKKDWLKNAFSKPKASTDVTHNRGQTRDEAASRAKMLFKERSSRKLSAGPSRMSAKPAQSYRAKEAEALAAAGDFNEGTNRVAPEENTVAKLETTNVMYSEQPEYGLEEVQDSFDTVDEDQTPVDFRAAREALIQRSKKNGHNAQVVNKVFLRKKKFEQLEEESRRKSVGVGLVIKTSWDLADTSKGRPSNLYEKKIVQAPNIAPKKSFEDLP